MGQHRVEGLATEPGVPVGPVWVVPEAAHELEGLPAVRGAEDGAGFRAGPHDTVLDTGLELPDALQRGVGVAREDGGAPGGTVPGLAEVVRAPHLRSQPARGRPGEQAWPPTPGVERAE